MNQYAFQGLVLAVKIAILGATIWFCFGHSSLVNSGSYGWSCWGGNSGETYEEIETGFPATHESKRIVSGGTVGPPKETESEFDPSSFVHNVFFVGLITTWLFLSGLIGTWKGLSRWFVAMTGLMLIVIWPTLLTSQHIEKSCFEMDRFEAFTHDAISLNAAQSIPPVFSRLGVSDWVPDRWKQTVDFISVEDFKVEDEAELQKLLKDFTRLRSLQLSGEHLDDGFVKRNQKHLETIGYLGFADTSVTNEIFDALADGEHLVDLDLSFTRVTSFDEQVLTKFPKLEYLDLSGCPLNQETKDFLELLEDSKANLLVNWGE